jgi:Terpene cyclase DEP1
MQIQRSLPYPTTSNDLFFLCVVAVRMLVKARRHAIRFVWNSLALSFVVAISVTFPRLLIARERKLPAAVTGASGFNE